MLTTCRWHITRLYREKSGAGYVEATIFREKSNFFKDANLKALEEVATILREELDWWNPDEDQQIVGYTTEQSLIDALSDKNVDSSAKKDPKKIKEERKIEEDMVFLQFLEDKLSFEQIWENLRLAEDLPDVSDLIERPDGRWVDFTKQAREMAANLYGQLLRK